MEIQKYGVYQAILKATNQKIIVNAIEKNNVLGVEEWVFKKLKNNLEDDTNYNAHILENEIEIISDKCEITTTAIVQVDQD